MTALHSSKFPILPNVFEVFFILPTQKINDALKYYVSQPKILSSSKNNISDLDKALSVVSE